MIAQLRQLGLTPAKGALVAVLAVSLAVVWGPQLTTLFGGGQESSGRRPVAGVASARLSPTRSRPSGQAAKPTQSAPKPERPQSSIGLAEAISHDPFAPPAWSPVANSVANTASAQTEVPPPSELKSRFQVLKSSGVAMILTSEKGQAVQIGEETLRVGDRLKGFEVVEITPTGVVFQPAADEGDDRGA